MTHPGVAVISAFLAESGVTTGTVAEQRAAMAAAGEGTPPPGGVQVRTTTLAGRPAETLIPDGPVSDAMVLYLHGGGYCSGSPDSHRGLGARLAVATGCAVTVLDYRLAPEHPFPAALDDAMGAYDELMARGARPERTAIAGDSAGGGLTIATLLALRDAGHPLPAAAVCLSPWVDLTQSAPSYQRLATLDPMVSKAGLDLMAEAYLGTTDPRDGLASPLFADDLSGLPPVRVEVGELEVLIDDATRLVERLQHDGVTSTLTVWPELIHVFQAFPGSLVPEADQSVAAIGAFLAEQFDTH